jgi:UDP-N-acetylglucosamine--N-acetylmuramyl-(pentapeptide) pyrophosphoryl-undecaprenol N-acetylglucosamine transferase
MKRVLIMAGGTGGHIIPALAVAKLLQQQGVQIRWLGTEHGLENQLVPAANIAIDYIPIQGMRGKGIKALLLAPWRILVAVGHALRNIRRYKPNLILGFGGFVSGPGGLAAWLLRTPLIIHEQNSVAGMTNRYLAGVAASLLQAFPNTFPERYHALTVGNPVRENIVKIPAPQQRLQNRQGNLQILILGGSQGAAVFNEVLPATLALLTTEQKPLIWHSTGKRYLDITRAAYQKHAITARIDGFIEDMSAAYAWADLVICRSGALTIAELTAAGVASILIPYPHAVDDHQTRNGEFLVSAQAALLIPQAELHAQQLAKLLVELHIDRNRLLIMAVAARKLAITDATQKVINCCSQYL